MSTNGPLKVAECSNTYHRVDLGSTCTWFVIPQAMTFIPQQAVWCPVDYTFTILSWIIWNHVWYSHIWCIYYMCVNCILAATCLDRVNGLLVDINNYFRHTGKIIILKLCYFTRATVVRQWRLTLPTRLLYRLLGVFSVEKNEQIWRLSLPMKIKLWGCFKT